MATCVCMRAARRNCWPRSNEYPGTVGQHDQAVRPAIQCNHSGRQRLGEVNSAGTDFLAASAMEPFGGARSEVKEADPLKDMVGTWGLEPQTSTVSKLPRQVTD
jgi:hypothetical protein